MKSKIHEYQKINIKVISKKIISICAAILMTAYVFAQAPSKMSYQAVIRNSSNALVTSTAVGMRISILQTSATGTAVYVETQTPTTNANGLASLEIGAGTVVSGNFANINWGSGPFFIKIETDPTGGTSYTITGTSQLLSVPYALFSGNGIVGVSATGDTLYLGNGNHLIIPGISASNNSGSGGQTGITQHSCGANSVHNPNLTYGSMTDQDGNTYKTILIGTQEWMAENLKASHYRNGDLIPVVTNNTSWQSLTTSATCWYSNDSASYNCPYGKLYNWYAAADVRNLCPTGWHVPSDSEWNILVMQIDPAADTTCSGCSQSTIAGDKMKSMGPQYWSSPNTAADNSNGFSGLPGGYRNGIGAFDSVGYYGDWWSSTQYSTNGAWDRVLDYSGGNVSRTNYVKHGGFSVRCLRH